MNISKTALTLLAVLALVVLLAASTSADPGNDNWQEATDVYDGNTESHTVAAAGGGNPADEDWFRIFVTEGQFLQLGMIFDPANGAAGIRVYGPTDHTRQVARSTNTDLNAQEVDIFIFAEGTYYIRVYVFDGTDAQYQMEVQVWTPPVLQSGISVANGADPLRGRIMSSLWYRVWLEGDNETAEMANVEMNWAVPNTNTHLIIYDRKDNYTLNVLNYSWSRNVDRAEDCRFGASYAGYYYIRVYTTTAFTAAELAVTFNLKATVLASKHRADGNVVKADAQLIEIRETVRGKINQAYDTHEWYAFYLNEGEQFSAKASITDPKLTTHWDFYNLTLYSHNGTILAGANNQDENTGAPFSSVSIFRGKAPYTGKYFMAFSAWYSLSGSGTTDYTNGRLVNSCRFEIDVLIPNRRVWIIDPPGEIRMDEDTEVTRDLTKVFWDPEGDELTFGTIGGKANFTMVLSQSTGLLTIRPDADWYGSEEISVWAHDGRPDMKNVTKIMVTVRSVADPPFVKEKAPKIVHIFEDEVNTTALNLYTVFDDVDIEDKFLIFSSDQNEYVNLEIDQTSGRVTLWGEEHYNGPQKLTFYAADSYNYRQSHQISVIVDPTNDIPEAVGKIPRLSMQEGMNSHIDVGTFFMDIDGDDLFYYAEWDQEDAISFDNAESNPLNSWFDIYPEDPNFYGYVQVIFICYDRDPLDPELFPEEARQSAILEVENVNDPPRIDRPTPDLDPTINELESVTFKVDADFIYDVDSTMFRWKWFVNDEEQVDISGDTFMYPSEPGFDDAGVYLIRCEVKDSLGEPANIAPEWILTIKNTNRAPTVNLISKDTNVEEGSKVRLRADGYDQDDDSLIFEWYQVNEAGQEQKIGLGRDYTVDKPLAPGSYRFRCLVSDGEAKVGSDYIQVATVPGFGGFFAVLAMISALAMAIVVRRRL
jgi:hypothetical protein